jgi:hypothetical protein
VRGCAAHSYMFLCSLANALGSTHAWQLRPAFQPSAAPKVFRYSTTSLPNCKLGRFLHNWSPARVRCDIKSRQMARQLERSRSSR